MTASDGRAWLAVFVSVLPIYLLTAHYLHGSVDTKSAVAPAWQLVHHGNLWVEHLRPRPYWSVPAGQHLVSNRMPGLELINVPLVALLYPLGPSLVPGALTAAILTAATVALLFLTFRRLVSTRLALLATAVMAFGTSLWTISAAEVWPHTVDAFCLALVMYAVSRRRDLLAGLAFGLAISARPHIAIVALIVGLGLGWANRSWRTVVAVGLPASVGLAFVVGWNNLLFGHPSVGGGYASYVQTNLTQTTGGSGRFFATNVLGFLFSPQRGLFVFLPLALLLLLGVRSAWRGAEPWARALAAGGLAYTLVQLKINGFDGGDAFFGSRLSTELVVCAAPLGVVCVRSWVAERNWRMRVARSLAAVSVGLQAIGALAFSVRNSSASTPWRWSPVLDALWARPALTLVLLWTTALIACWLVQREPSGLGQLRQRLTAERREELSVASA